MLFENLSIAGTKPGVLSLVPKFSDNYVPKSCKENFPTVLRSLQDSSYLKLRYDQLLVVCESIFESLVVTDDMAASVEKETRSQSKSTLWYKHRAGTITSSRMKAVCHTNSTNPAQSLVKSICFTMELNFSSKETDWGQKHEKTARDQYFRQQKSQHEHLEITDSGLVINPRWPFIAASPDGVINCDCHGKGVLEIKCPFTHRHETITEAVINDSNFCLEELGGSLQLDHKHTYYYQVQT